MRKIVSSTLRIAALAGALAVPLAAASPAHADWHGRGGWHGGGHGGWGWHGGARGCCWRGGVFIGLPPVYVPPPLYYPPPPVYYAPPPVYYPPPYAYRY